MDSTGNYCCQGCFTDEPSIAKGWQTNTSYWALGLCLPHHIGLLCINLSHFHGPTHQSVNASGARDMLGLMQYEVNGTALTLNCHAIHIGSTIIVTSTPHTVLLEVHSTLRTIRSQHSLVTA